MDLHVNLHFGQNGRWITKDKKIDFIFWRFFKIVIWRPMLKFCSLVYNCITYPKSIGSLGLGLCYTDAEISERKVTPWPCNNFAGQCILCQFNIITQNLRKNYPKHAFFNMFLFQKNIKLCFSAISGQLRLAF